MSHEKKIILVVADEGREDFIKIFKQSLFLSFVFVDTASISLLSISIYKKYGRIIFWEDYADAFALMDKIKPNKVVFFNFESFNQVALLSVSKQLGIETIHMEHGLKLNMNSEALKQLSFSEWIRLFVRKRSFSKNIILFKNKFYSGSVSKSNSSNRQFLKKYFNLRVIVSTSNVYKILKENMVVPDHFISPNETTLNHHITKHRLSRRTIKSTFIGYPQFDFLRPLFKIKNASGSIVLFIDQPLSEQNLFGWTKKNKKKFLEDLQKQIDPELFFVKPHPRNDVSDYSPNINLLKDGALLSVLEKTTIVLGFYSTLMLPIAALNYITVFVFENHPHKLPEKLSALLTNAGVANEIKTPKELKMKLSNFNEYREKQKNHKPKYIKEWNLFLENSGRDELVKVLSV